MRRRSLVTTAVAAPALVRAQSRQTRIVVPFAPGGPADFLARLVAPAVAEALKQSVVVDNKAGAGGTIGVDAVAKAAPDRSTFAVVPVGNIAVNPTLISNLPYKQTDLVPIAMLARVENALVVRTELPVQSLKDLVELARRRPGALSFASPGAGSQAHLAGELLKVRERLFIVHVPYRGIAPALNDVLSGEVTLMFAPLSLALPHVKAGKLRALGVASANRSPLAPEVPTIAEQGLPAFEAVSWYALMGPAGTPADVVARVNAEAVRALGQPDVKDKLAAQGMAPGSDSPQQLAATIRAETERWAAVIRTQNLQPE
ncbi:MAG TPA: tripartite tricarboxylate transporter substrate binding protein [Burkholderiaceae bacterium]|nr:tripartite tricarboxylate transporter substrate binding protein [Burkholderiaceae bacterium]